MFPLMHYYIGKNILAADSSVIALASVLPDLCVNMGLTRAFGHTSGEDFYRWCRIHCRAGEEVALAFATHGTTPQGLDYYSDEVWPGGERGFCFQCAESYVPQVIEACAIPEDWALWKGHNLVEMAFEADIAAKTPQLCSQMIAAAEEEAAVNFVAQVFAAFAGIEAAQAGEAMRKIPVIFGIAEGSPRQLAEKYNRQLELRHGIVTASIAKITDLIQHIRTEQKEQIEDFVQRVFPLIAQNFQKMQEKYRKI